jgi:hypothetical protein
MRVRAQRTEEQDAARHSVAGVTVSHPSDTLEQEANRVAEHVTSAFPGGDRESANAPSHAPAITRHNQKASAADLQSDGTGSDAEGMVASSLASGGTRLGAETRRSMESRFGHDFSQVRVHAGEKASQAAHSIGASAYTVGDDIGFAAGQYAPGTAHGDRLLAHELTHVVQRAPDGPLVQRAPNPNNQAVSADPNAASSSADGLSPQLRADVQATLNLWRTQANQCVLDSAAWYADNYGQFISLTSSNSTLSWTDGKVFGVFEKAVGWGVGKAVSSLAGAMLGAEIGSIGGPPGMVAGFVVGKVAGEITSEIIAGLKGPDQTKARNAAQAGQAATASGQTFFQQAGTGQGLVTSIFGNAQKNLDKATSATTAFAIRDWALQEIAAVKPPPKGDRSLFQQMYSEWALEHSQGTRLPVPHIGAGEGVDAAQWANAVQNAPLVDGKAVTAHLDLFGYQTRGFLSSKGLSPDKGQDMIQAAQGASSQDAGRIMAQFDNKPFTFTIGDPALLSTWLGNAIGWQQDSDPVQPKDVSDGRVKVEVTPNLSLFAAAPGVSGGSVAPGQPQGAISVTSFHVTATVPDRHTFVSSDPADAGLPAVITDRGLKTYQLGKINP